MDLSGRVPAGLDLFTGQWERPAFPFVKPAPALDGRREFVPAVDLHDIAWDDFGVYDPDDETFEPLLADEEEELFDLARMYAAGERVDPIQLKPAAPGAARRYDLHDGWHRIQAARLAGVTHLDTIVISPDHD